MDEGEFAIDAELLMDDKGVLDVKGQYEALSLVAHVGVVKIVADACFDGDKERVEVSVKKKLGVEKPDTAPESLEKSVDDWEAL